MAPAKSVPRAALGLGPDASRGDQVVWHLEAATRLRRERSTVAGSAQSGIFQWGVVVAT